MAESKCINPANVKQAATIFEQIAGIASNADRVCFHTPAGDQESVAELATMLREAICRIGWLADLGAEKTDGSVTRDSGKGANAEEWILPPPYHSATKGEGVSV